MEKNIENVKEKVCLNFFTFSVAPSTISKNVHYVHSTDMK